MAFSPQLARSWSPKLHTLPNLSPEIPNSCQPLCFRSERWFIRSPPSLSSASYSLVTPRCRATMAGAPVEALTLRDICGGKLPQHILKRAEELGYAKPTDVQQKSLPVLLSGRDCVLQAETGSGKTLAYLLLTFSAINFQRSAVQAVIVVPTRELGMQVTKVARMLVAKSAESDNMQRACTIMALLDGGMLKRHKSWLKAETPEIVVATIGSLSQMLERHVFKPEALQILVVDEVDFMFNSSKQVYALRKLLTSHSTIQKRQTVFVSASIPQHNRFLYDCVQHKWTKNDVVHIHVNPIQPMPSHLHHSFVICGKRERLSAVLYLLQRDTPRSAIVFVSEQSEKSKRAGRPSAALLFEYLKDYYNGCLEVSLIEEDMNFNARAASLSALQVMKYNVKSKDISNLMHVQVTVDIRERGFLLVATDLASRGFDLPQTTHIYNFDPPKTAVDYLHRAGRTRRLPFSTDEFWVTSLITPEERFVLQRYQNELLFECKEVVLESLVG